MATLPLASEPRDLLLDNTNDLVISGGDLQFTYGIQAVVQSCRIALQMFQGEWFLDINAGIPYWDTILGAKPDAAIVAARIAFRSALAQVDGVVSVPLCEVKFMGATRTAQVTFVVTTALGTTPADTIALAVGGTAP